MCVFQCVYVVASAELNPKGFHSLHSQHFAGNLRPQRQWQDFLCLIRFKKKCETQTDKTHQKWAREHGCVCELCVSLPAQLYLKTDKK